MPRGIPNAKSEPLPEVEEFDAYSPRSVPPKFHTMKLLRHHCPQNEYEIVGWQKPAVMKKMPNGKMETIEPAEFIKGEPAPPPLPGVSISNKLWAGTVARFTIDEAKHMRAHGVAEAEIEG